MRAVLRPLSTYDVAERQSRTGYHWIMSPAWYSVPLARSALGGIRTPNCLFRKEVVYPVDVQEQHDLGGTRTHDLSLRRRML